MKNNFNNYQKYSNVANALQKLHNKGKIAVQQVVPPTVTPLEKVKKMKDALKSKEDE